MNYNKSSVEDVSQPIPKKTFASGACVLKGVRSATARDFSGSSADETAYPERHILRELKVDKPAIHPPNAKAIDSDLYEGTVKGMEVIPF